MQRKQKISSDIEDIEVVDAAPTGRARRRKQTVTELDSVREMERVGEYYLELPGAPHIECASQREYAWLREYAQPYLDAEEEITADGWNDVYQYLCNCLSYYVADSKSVEIRKQIERIKNPEKKKEYESSNGELLSELLKQKLQLQRMMNEQRLKLDQLRSMTRSQGANLVEYLEKIEAQAVEFANEHLGEFQWMTCCPNLECKHYREPFIVLQQSPHFAYDFSSSPYIIWNQQTAKLTRKFYRNKKDWDDEDRKTESRGLSFSDAAGILGISPIGWMAAIYERCLNGTFEFPLDLESILNKPATLAKYIGAAGGVFEDSTEGE